MNTINHTSCNTSLNIHLFKQRTLLEEDISFSFASESESENTLSSEMSSEEEGVYTSEEEEHYIGSSDIVSKIETIDNVGKLRPIGNSAIDNDLYKEHYTLSLNREFSFKLLKRAYKKYKPEGLLLKDDQISSENINKIAGILPNISFLNLSYFQDPYPSNEGKRAFVKAPSKQFSPELKTDSSDYLSIFSMKIPHCWTISLRHLTIEHATVTEIDLPLLFLEHVAISGVKLIKKINLSNPIQSVSVKDCPKLLDIKIVRVKFVNIQNCELLNNIEILRGEKLAMSKCPKCIHLKAYGVEDLVLEDLPLFAFNLFFVNPPSESIGKRMVLTRNH